VATASPLVSPTPSPTSTVAGGTALPACVLNSNCGTTTTVSLACQP
jgi:hypothetical protein